MKKVKFLVCMLLSLAMLVPLAACGGDGGGTPQGGNGTYEFTLASGDLTVDINLQGANVEDLKWKGRTVEPSSYAVTDTKLVLKKAYLQTLDLGEQTLTLTTDAGKVDIILNLSDKEAPVIGDSVAMDNWKIELDTMFTFPEFDVRDGHRIEMNNYYIKKTSEPNPDKDFVQIGQDWTPSSEEDGYKVGDTFDMKYEAVDAAGNKAEKVFKDIQLSEKTAPNVIDLCNSPQGLSKWFYTWAGETNSLISFGYVTDEITGPEGAYKVVSGDSRTATGNVWNQYALNPFPMDSLTYKYLSFEVYNNDDRPLKLCGNLYGSYLTEDIPVEKGEWTTVLLDLDWYTAVGLTGASWGFGIFHKNESDVPHEYYIRNFILVERADTEDYQIRADFESNSETYLGNLDEAGNPTDYRGSQITKAEGGKYSWSDEQASSGEHSMKIVPAAENGTLEFNLLNSPNLELGTFAPYGQITFDVYANGNTISEISSFGYDLKNLGATSGKEGWTTYSLDLKQAPKEGTQESLNLWLDAKIHGEAGNSAINYLNVKMVSSGTNAIYVDNVRYYMDGAYAPEEPDFRFSWEEEGDAGTDTGKYVALSGGSFSLDDTKSTDGSQSLLMVADGTGINIAVAKTSFGMNGEKFTAASYFAFDIFVEEGATVTGTAAFGNYGWNTEVIPTGRWATVIFTLDRIPADQVDSYFNSDAVFYIQISALSFSAGARVWFDNFCIYMD